MTPMSPEAVISRVVDKNACWYVYGYAKTPSGMKPASFVVWKGDIERMNAEQFESFALRKLPQTIEGTRYEVNV